MTLDDELIKQLTNLATCSKLVNAAERSQILLDIEQYRKACKLSNGKDRSRNADWSANAYKLGHVLQGWFRKITGRPYLDMNWFKRCDKCDTE
jgi:hypothetical protein